VLGGNAISLQVESQKWEDDDAIGNAARVRAVRVALALSDEAYICTFECTFCPACTRAMAEVCPNCGGELVRRPAPHWTLRRQTNRE
jgi:hypothetical protein